MPTPETWFDRADRYLANADLLHGEDDREAMVQLSQAAEYALKGVLTAQTGSHRRGHDHVALANEASAPSRFDRTLTYLEQTYARRYPDDQRLSSSSDYEQLHNDVEELIQWARNTS